jgi:hypothetical protein
MLWTVILGNEVVKNLGAGVNRTAGIVVAVAVGVFPSFESSRVVERRVKRGCI